MADKKGSQQRAYVVVLVADQRLKPVDWHVQARSAEHACDLVVEQQPVEQRNGTFAAFLAGSYRQFDYQSTPTVLTTKQPSNPAGATLFEVAAEALVSSGAEVA